jgi:diaminopimelate decarboxylase
VNRSLYQGWWQRNDLCYQQEQLVFAGHPVEGLADRCGTPAFVYAASRVQENLDRLHRALTRVGLGGRYSLYYAMKANRFAPLLTFLKQTGLCGIDACSPGEVEHAVSCGFSPSDISFTASSLSARDLAVLIRYKGMLMNCDSLHAIRCWGALRPGSIIGIRINPGLGIGRTANDRLHYAGNATTKFGIYEEQFVEALELAGSYDLRVGRIHFHTGCGYLTPQLEQLERIIACGLRFVDAAGGQVARVNIGGGLGVPHVAADQPLDLDRWAAVLQQGFKGRDLHLEIEPGDYIVKDAGLLLLGTTFVERKKNVVFVGVDGGFNLAPEPAHYNLPFQPVPLRDDDSVWQEVRVVGNINEALDVWDEQAWLPDMSGHRYLALINAGAYSAAMASNHCMRGGFKEFLLF